MANHMLRVLKPGSASNNLTVILLGWVKIDTKTKLLRTAITVTRQLQISWKLTSEHKITVHS